MTVPITPSAVTAVLLADGWHQVRPLTFTVGPYRYANPVSPQIEEMNAQGGTGFSFMELDTANSIAGPLTSVLAVQH